MCPAGCLFLLRAAQEGGVSAISISHARDAQRADSPGSAAFAEVMGEGPSVAVLPSASISRARRGCEHSPDFPSQRKAAEIEVLRAGPHTGREQPRV